MNPLDLTVTVVFLHGDLLKRPHSDIIAVADIPLSALWQSSDHFQNFSFHSHQLVRLLIYQTGQLCQFIEFMRVFGRLRPVTVITLGDGQDSVPCFLFGFHQDVNFMIYVSRPFQKRPCFITHETSPPSSCFQNSDAPEIQEHFSFQAIVCRFVALAILYHQLTVPDIGKIGYVRCRPFYHLARNDAAPRSDAVRLSLCGQKLERNLSAKLRYFALHFLHPEIIVTPFLFFGIETV